MKAIIPCKNCKVSLTVELKDVRPTSGAMQGDYDSHCPVCGPISGTVIFQPAPRD